MKVVKKVFLLIFSLLLVGLLSACDMFNNSDNQDDKLEASKQEVEEKLNNLANKDGFEITYQYYSSDTPTAQVATIGAYKGYSWYYNGDKESGIAFEKSNGLTLYYTLNDGNWEYQYAYSYDASDSHYNMDLTAQFSMFLQAYEFDTGLSKAKQATIAGRSCDVYTYSVSQKGKIVSSLTGVDATWSYYIDKELGICLKFEVSGDDGSTSSTSTFEVTSFKTNAKLDGLKRPMDVYPINAGDPNVTGNWNMLAFVGLSSIAPDKESFVSDDLYHSMEILGSGVATYYFKIYDLSSISDALDYMADYYSGVVETIKTASDDHKCYQSIDGEALEETPSVLEDESLIYSMLFIYHGQLYEISFMLEDGSEFYDGAFILEIRVNKAND